MLKRIACLCLIATILLSGASVFAGTSEEADVLYNLKLMKGNGDGFDLYSKLKRSEAATFIVKLMGLEEHVMSQKK